MEENIRESLRKLLDYVYADEERDYESYDDRPDLQANHIFNHIKELSAWEYAERKRFRHDDEGLPLTNIYHE